VHAAAAAVAVDPGQFSRVGDVLKKAGYAGDGQDPAALQAHAKAIYNATGAEIQAHQSARMRPENTPSNVLEYQYYTGLPPAEQKKYLEMKRTMNPFTQVDLAGGKATFDKRSGATTPLTTADQEAAGQAKVSAAKAGATETATKTADVSFDLPRLEQNVTQSLKAIDALRGHPGLPYMTGLYSKVPIIPGTKQAAASALAEQLQGKTFLEAYNTLKGSGQISNVEGEKAQAAIGRLNRSQSTEDYQSALDDLKSVLVSGLDRARAQSGGPHGAAPTAPAAAPAQPNAQAVPQTNAKGWVLHVDANDNKAYVSPDRKQFEPVP
jgi:hypothetical protein